MKVVVDGDSCPSRNIIEKAARELSVEMEIFCDVNHHITSEYSKVIYMDSGFQSVDMAIFNSIKSGDIVVTGDFGVASMVIGKKAYAISPKGYVFDEDNMDRLLFERHISQKVRRSGGRTQGPKKRLKEDDVRLYESLKTLIMKANE
ncbi:YaiI/YqxD family protein [Clostridium sp. MSJ-4]|uniref:UPF0178 protein KQI89_09775 n=1 Tax=Clostridium simiarum TaxID=2841506 RepID=A0ABS6F372_9CLOT|nr:YaiI/YqxD family protein [Clostridium simiarum]MBU5592058.1 YaiI/YqxD family protein [Clostridium simiarum]